MPEVSSRRPKICVHRALLPAVMAVGLCLSGDSGHGIIRAASRSLASRLANSAGEHSGALRHSPQFNTLEIVYMYSPDRSPKNAKPREDLAKDLSDELENENLASASEGSELDLEETRNH